MGLVARAVEAQGIATISLSIVREITEKTPPPRALYLRFPFGHALGEPENEDQHLRVLQLAFEHLFAAKEPGAIADAGLRWRRETYTAPDWGAWKRIGSRAEPGGSA